MKSKLEAKSYNAGEVIEYDSTENGYARIRLGNSKVAKVYVNDEELTYAQESYNAKHYFKIS